MNLLEMSESWLDTHALYENSTDKAKGTLNAIISTLEKNDNPTSQKMFKMAKGIMDYYDKNKSFSPEQAKWIYNTSKALFN